ncbi:ABC transporter permease [Prauserella marina]|uniref:Iron complex transport system permease protein n=1 Tax=Prauserella marina TaxID=530584 RepID=A0A222VP29_9PSEU|nr:iron chelate uptake ABC transporter family permease subunit [Prauserella marina]ASR35676.1 ABC transporter permease [Prauserella marina]PWV84448.1 iron complex transport system permease protein [Prauserella marina]SDC22330.1 iron complex transport system permease protein [Prauserella marina]
MTRTITPAPVRPTAARVLWFAVSLIVLAVMFAVSVAVGSANLPLSTVWSALVSPDGGIDHSTIRTLRVPRTVLGVLVGAALGVAGALMQGLTRNPLADPGILGVNSGAGFAIVAGVAMFGVTRIEQYLWLGFAGAVVAAAIVYAIASRGPGGANPLRLTLVGVAFGAVLTGASQTLALINPDTFDRFRYWDAGSITDRPDGTVSAVLPFILIGLVLAFACARALNALALGDDLAKAVGARVGLIRLAGVVAVTLLCGAATAAAGPIVFVGLMIPHAVRLLVGPDQRWILPLALVLGPVLVLTSDVIGRLVIWPAELQVGVVTAFLGAPVLIALVRRGKPGAS